MQHLSLAGVSEDGRRLLLVDDSGKEFTLTIDARLRAALRGEHARIGQLEIQMDSTLRPRDIQARIRAGESPEAVAQAAKTTVEKILPFANPVLAERAHVAERAQRSSLRRRNGGDAGARTLGDAVASQLRSLNVAPEAVEWDAWRREDGRWNLTASYTAGRKKGAARFAFDAPGNFVLTENDDARWLVGDAVAAAEEPTPRDDLRQARERRLTAVAQDELPLGDDAIELANDSAEESTVDLTETASRVRGAGVESSPESGPVELSPTPEPFAEPVARRSQEPVGDSFLDSVLDRSAAPVADTRPVAEPRTEPKPKTEPAVEAEPEQPRKPARKNRGRASVPSWDEIMFGGGKSE